MDGLSDTSPPPRVGIVVVNWRSPAVTRECLLALERLDYTERQLVLVDNGSSDFCAADLERLPFRAAYLRTPHNLGFAGGSNLGMRSALEDGAAYVWFLNNDATAEPDALRELVAVAHGTPAAIVGAKVLRKRDPARLDSIALDVDLDTGRMSLAGHDEIDRGQYDRLSEVGAVTGCAMLVERGACERLGGFDESFFSYLEDADLCLRARAAGLRVAVAPRARVLHDRPSARRGRQSTASLYYTTRNHLALMRRHGVERGRVRRALAVLALNLAYAARPGAGDALARLGAVCRGALDYRRGVIGAREP